MRRVVLVLVLLTPVVLASSFFCEYTRAASQQHLVQQLRQRGYDVVYDWQRDGDASLTRGARTIRKILGEHLFAHVVIVSGSALSDSDLELICQLPVVEEIEGIPSYDVSDHGLEKISKLIHLRSLPPIRSASITDASIDQLGALPKLERLSISGHITDPGLVKLAQMNSLKVLEVLSPDITDSGVLAFRGSTNLKALYLGGGTVSDESLRLLGDANQSLIVEHRPEQF